MSRLRRIVLYLREMFPLHVHGVAAVVMSGSFLLLARATGDAEVRLEPDALFGLATVFLSLLLLRAFDELKDREVDPDFFPDRPLVTGEVRYSDIRLLALLCILVLVPLNLGRGPATSLFLVYFAAMVLSWQWWLFRERISRSLLLTLVTHQPLVPLMFLYLYGVYLETSGSAREPLTALAIVLAFWPPMLAWEIGRKVRAPGEETAYPTYSLRWGPRRAAAVALGAVLSGGAGMVGLALAFDLSSGFAIYHAAAAAVASLPILRFIQRPGKETNRVQRGAEGYVFLCYGGTAVLLLLPELI